MKPEYVSLLAGFVGAIVGALASLGAIWLQQRAQDKRDRAKFALDAAVKEYESAEKYAEFMAKHGQPTASKDLGYYIILNAKIAEYPILRARDYEGRMDRRAQACDRDQ